MSFSDEINDKSCCNKDKIHCEVENCIFHDCEGDQCTARQIKVGPEDASTKSETICGTFKER